MAVCQSLMYQLSHRYREQVESSHRPFHIFNRISRGEFAAGDCG
jgi:hypothetical protein